MRALPASARSRAIRLGVAAAFVFAPLAAAAGTSLDGSFGNGGKVVTDFGASEHLSAVAMFGNGGVVAAGATIAPNGTADIALARYRRDGTLDPSFGGDGRVETNVGLYDFAEDIAIDREGRVVVAGGSSGTLVLARYLPDGELDPTFGPARGILTARFGPAASLRRVFVQSDGMIVAVARVADDRAILLRFRADGRLDRSFGAEGTVETDLPMSDAALTRGGKIVVVGTRRDHQKQRTGDGFPVLLTVARYTADGKLDPSFGAGGVARFDLRETNCCYGEAVAVARDGSIVIAGYGERSGPAVTRLRPNGARDASFGQRDAQTLLPPAGAGVGRLQIDPRGRIVVAIRLAGNDIAVTRLTPRGALDARFGSNVIDFGRTEDTWALAVQAGGRVVVGGYTGGRLLDASAPNDFALARYVAPPCRVPDVRRVRTAVATQRLERAGCRAGAVRLVRSTAKAGLVVTQRPAHGAVVAEDTPVALTISRGRR